MDIVVTWPAYRPLSSYLVELERAEREGKTILFKVPAFPRKLEPGDRCYMVHEGFVRGYNIVKDVTNSVQPIDPLTGNTMPEGIYVVRDPHWWELTELIPKKGFQSFHYAPRWWSEIL